MCALFGIFDYTCCLNKRQKEIVLSVLSHECEIRGHDATGIAYLRNKKLQVHKKAVPASEMRYNLPPKVKTIMGHTRLTTQGNASNNYNNHPFFGRVKNNTFVLAHNGILRNDHDLRQSMKLPKTHIETDSYVAVQLIEKENSVSFDSLKKVAETVQGSFVFTVLDKHNNLYFVRGDNPLCIYHFAEKGFYLYASTENILQMSLKILGIDKYCHEKIRVEMGDILRIDNTGNIEKQQFEIIGFYEPRYSYHQYPVYIYESRNSFDNKPDYNEHLEMLKQLSGLYGYTPDDIDKMIANDWTLDEIEQILYGESISIPF